MDSIIDQEAGNDEAAPQVESTETAPGDVVGREARIAIAAFYLAEARGFEPGRELEDWLQAERQIDESLTSV